MAKITPDDRVLKQGQPSLLLAGDTCWSAFTNMTDAEWRDYIIKRAAQGFNVVQVNALPPVGPLRQHTGTVSVSHRTACILPMTAP